MPKPLMSDEQWINFLKECRSSGMSDKDWCIMHGIHPSTLYKVIKRLRQKACEIPDHEENTVSLKQEVALVASIDENGVLTKTQLPESVPLQVSDTSMMPLTTSCKERQLETTVRIVMPSGVQVEMSNNANAATIRNILGVLQTS
ncbi:MAG: helix-turn-helix domain-containing protein [Butyrivibrio sp.]|uniref:IS66 family insertion sequence element accessory protein TnpA n=1 Tax=Butyrivibrio sp. TaxID=28121 RepID=UPI001B050EC7|nr:helix-turn-helix domain-containing protein [Butyrivibrio sp.]MBO6240631.1 helix-turn-helix domain-containing protein [Butyrivibrio sp.]